MRESIICNDVEGREVTKAVRTLKRSYQSFLNTSFQLMTIRRANLLCGWVYSFYHFIKFLQDVLGIEGDPATLNKLS